MWSHSCEVPGGVRFTETESRGVVAGLERAGEVGVGRQMGVDRGGLLPHGGGASVWEDGKVLEVDGGDGGTTM